MAEKNRKLSEAVRKYSVLYDKSLPGFHMKDEKNVARGRVASQVGLKEGKQAQTLFSNLRTKYGKKASYQSEKTSGKGLKEIKKLKEDFERYIFLSWLHPYMSDRKKKGSNILCDDEIESNDGESNCAHSELNSPPDVTINDLMDQINTNDTNFQENAYIPPDHENPSCSQIDSISTVPAAPQIYSNLVKKRPKPQLKRGSEDPIDVQQMKTVNDALTNKSDESSHDIFCKYVACEFKKLSVGAQDFLTVEINNAICKAKRFDRENQQPNLYKMEKERPLSRFTQQYPPNPEPSYQQPNSPVYSQSYVQHTPRKTYNPQYSYHRSPLQLLSQQEPSPVQHQLQNNYEFQMPSSASEPSLTML